MPSERRCRAPTAFTSRFTTVPRRLSDGLQGMLLPHQFLDLMGDLRRLATALGREFWAPTEK